MHRGPITVGPESVSDDELIGRFLDAPSSQGGHEAFEQLWQRYHRYAAQTIRAMLYLAPDGYDRQAFGQDALQQASVNLLQRMHGYRGPERVRQYLKRVVETSVLDERRVILQRALAMHGQQSHAGTKSVVAIRWRCWEGQTVGEIARTFRVVDAYAWRWSALPLPELERPGMTRSFLGHQPEPNRTIIPHGESQPGAPVKALNMHLRHLWSFRDVQLLSRKKMKMTATRRHTLATVLAVSALIGFLMMNLLPGCSQSTPAVMSPPLGSLPLAASPMTPSKPTEVMRAITLKSLDQGHSYTAEFNTPTVFVAGRATDAARVPPWLHDSEVVTRIHKTDFNTSWVVAVFSGQKGKGVWSGFHQRTYSLCISVGCSRSSSSISYI